MVASTTGNMTPQALNSFLKTHHAEYDANVAEWDKYGKAYKGGRKYGQDCIIPHESEDITSTAYKLRLQHSFPVNYCSFGVNTLVRFLSKEKPEVKNAEFGSLDPQFIEDFDRQGMDIQGAVAAIATIGLTYGFGWVLVDYPSIENDGTRTVADDIAENVRPYCVFLPPQNVQSWASDDSGKLTWCLVKATVNDLVLDEKAAEPTITKNESPIYTLWTRFAWRKIDSEGKWLGGWVNHGLGIVPIVPIRLSRDIDGAFVPKSFLADIEPLNRELINTFSLLQEINYNQTFSKLVVKDGTIAPDNKSPDAQGVQTVSLGIKDVIQTTADAGDVFPRYIAPDASQAQILLNSIDTLIKEIIRTANLQKGIASESGQVASGIAHAYEFLDTNQALKSMAGFIAGILKEIIVIAGKWVGAEVKPEITFPADFGIETSSEIIERFRNLSIALSNMPEVLRTQFIMKLFNAEFPNADPKLKAELEKQLKSMGADEADYKAALAKYANKPPQEKPEEDEGGSGDVDMKGNMNENPRIPA